MLSLSQAQANQPVFINPSVGNLQTGFTTDFATGHFYFAFASAGVFGYASNVAPLPIPVFVSTGDSAIAFLFDALETDTSGSLSLIQATVTGGPQNSNVQFIAVDSSNAQLEVDAQLGRVHGQSTTALSAQLTTQTASGVPLAALAIDAAGRLYALNGAVVQVLGGLSASDSPPTPLTPATPGYFLSQFSSDNNPKRPQPFVDPTHVTFDSQGKRYICDQVNTRVIVQTASGVPRQHRAERIQATEGGRVASGRSGPYSSATRRPPPSSRSSSTARWSAPSRTTETECSTLETACTPSTWTARATL